MDDSRLLQKRILELSDRAAEKHYPAFTDFLNLDEQSTLHSLEKELYDCRLWGGYEYAERVIAGFGAADENEFPIEIIKISPLAPKFSETLTHRDFLGSLMALGIKREKTGDIIVSGNCARLICKNSVSEFIIENLDRIRHTPVKCEPVNSLPENAMPKLETKPFIVTSVRLDAVICAVYALSRSKVKDLFIQNLVFVNGRQCRNFSYKTAPGDIISIRHRGRFAFEEVTGKTKKDRLYIRVCLYR